MSMDPDNAEGHLALGLVRYYNYERNAAEQEFKNAIQLNPLSADAIHIYAHALAEDGRFEEGLQLMRQATELEPLSAHYQFCLGLTYAEARRWDEALFEFDKAKDTDSTFVLIEQYVSEVYFYKVVYDRAIEHTQRFAMCVKDDGGLLALRARIYAATGKGRGALFVLDSLRRKEGADPGALAAMYAMIGDKDSELAWLERAYRERSNLFWKVKSMPEFNSLRGDPRFKELLAKAGFTD